jgi:hypothetical protein
MRNHLSPLWIGWQRRGAKKLALRTTCWCCLAMGFFAPGLGCKGKHSVDYADVSGTVRFKGQPLPGGRVTFVAVEGAFPGIANIEPNGEYKISSPIGEVQIAVDNRMLRGGRTTPHLTRPGAEEKPVKGTWIHIPDRYWNPDRSGLKYTVKPGAQIHDIELTD